MVTARVQVMKWGNSKAVRLPKTVLDEAHIHEGDEMSIRVENGRIEMAPMKTPPTLEELVSRITPENCHRESNWGKPAGNEAW